MLQTAIVFCLDGDSHVVASREVCFSTRTELVHQAESDLRSCESVEAWQESVCVLRMKAHGQIEWQGGDLD